MFSTFRASRLAHRMLVLPVVFSASVAVLNAQTSAQAPAVASVLNTGTTLPVSNYNLQVPANLAAPAYSSSAPAADDPAEGATTPDQVVAGNSATHFNFLDAQYGRRRYGRPRYRGSNTNEDGSEKYTFFAGAGFTQPLGNTYKYLTPNYGFQIGGGRNFNKHLGTMIQFDYDHFGFTRGNISNQSCLYTYSPGPPASCDPNAADNGIDASSHIWSFSVDPTYTFYQGEGLGAYAVVGVGFYHKVADFSAPQEEEYYSPFYGYVPIDVQADFDHYTSNAVGFNGGFGLTYKFSRFSNERLFGEVRYVYIDNSQRQGYTTSNLNTTSYNGTDFYPANSNRTSYLPVKFGVRF